MYSLINILYVLSQFPTTISKNLRFESRFFHMLQFFPLPFSPFGFIRLDKFHFIISQSLDRFVKRYRADFYPARPLLPPLPSPRKSNNFSRAFFPNLALHKFASRSKNKSPCYTIRLFNGAR